MGTILTDVDAWLIAVLFGLAMVASWEIGQWHGRRRSSEERASPPTRLGDAVLAMLGLLLAFSFSLAFTLHEGRRQMAVIDSNAVADFATTASLVKEPLRSQLLDAIREYVEHRLAIATGGHSEEQLRQRLDEIQDRHNRMQGLVGAAVDAGSPVTVPLVNTLNALTSSNASRIAAVRNRLPAPIVLMLLLSALVAIGMVGNLEGIAGRRHVLATLGFITLVSMVVWVTLDLNQPQRGFITVSQESMRQVLSGLGK